MLLRSKLQTPVLLLLVFLPIMTLSSFYLYIEYSKVTKKVHAITYENFVNTQLSLIQNYIRLMQKNLGEDALQQLENSSELRKHYEKDLHVIVTPEVKYLYMLYYEPSKEGVHLRYLLDTSEKEEERAYFRQKFNPTTDIWEKARLSKHQQISTQKDSDVLWSTLVVPIIQKGEVVGAIGVDFAHKARENIQEVLLPLEGLYFYIALFMAIMLIVAYAQFMLYYKTRKKGLTDSLTQIYNRQYLFDFLKSAPIEQYQILMLDIDHFKKINDTYGHDVGDVVLRTVSKNILHVIRKQDVFVRYGGEEFIILLHKKDTQQCQEIAERILKMVENLNVKVSEHRIKVTISIGVNPYPERFSSVDLAIKIADKQLYFAKANGRNRVEIYTVNH